MQCENSSRVVLTKLLNPYKINISVERYNYHGQMRPLSKWQPLLASTWDLTLCITGLDSFTARNCNCGATYVGADAL